MLSAKDLELLANSSNRLKQIEHDFEQLGRTAMAALQTNDDLIILVVSLCNDLLKINPKSVRPIQVLGFLVERKLIEKSLQDTIIMNAVR